MGVRAMVPKGLRHASANASVTERVRWIWRQILSRGRPDAAAVARELGLSVRSLQRRILDEGHSFREILAQVRQELGTEYWNEPDMQIQETASLLGYEDVTSFTGHFGSWKGQLPHSNEQASDFFVKVSRWISYQSSGASQIALRNLRWPVRRVPRALRQRNSILSTW